MSKLLILPEIQEAEDAGEVERPRRYRMLSSAFFATIECSNAACSRR